MRESLKRFFLPKLPTLDENPSKKIIFTEHFPLTEHFIILLQSKIEET